MLSLLLLIFNRWRDIYDRLKEWPCSVSNVHESNIKPLNVNHFLKPRRQCRLNIFSPTKPRPVYCGLQKVAHGFQLSQNALLLTNLNGPLGGYLTANDFRLAGLSVLAIDQLSFYALRCPPYINSTILFLTCV
jgi:hypothetical protein